MSCVEHSVNPGVARFSLTGGEWAGGGRGL